MDNLPAVQLPGLLAARDRAKTAAGGSGEQYLKLEKSGLWVYGAETIEVQPGSLWAILPQSFVDGYIAWADAGTATVLGEEMRPATDPPIQLGELPTVQGGKWQKQMGLTLVCLNGEDAGTTCIYKTTSKGGIRAVGEVLGAIIDKLQAGETDMIVPIVSLETDSYIHKRYGRIFTPVLKIGKWESMTKAVGEAAAEVKQETPPEAPPDPAPEQEAPPEPPKDETPPPRRRRKRAA